MVSPWGSASGTRAAESDGELATDRFWPPPADGFCASWHSQRHLDGYRVVRADVRRTTGLSCGLKALARLVGLATVEVDRERLHLLPDDAVRAYVASDARLARELSAWRLPGSSRWVDPPGPGSAAPWCRVPRRGRRAQTDPGVGPSHWVSATAATPGPPGTWRIHGPPPRPPRRPPPEPTELLGILDAFDESTIIGFEPSRRHLEVHSRPLPFDPRAVGAGLFGRRAVSSWCSVGAVFTGRLRRLDDPGTPRGTATARVVLDRRGRLALSLDGDTHLDASDPPSGVLIDALHRVLGMASPGRAPHPARLVLAMWCTDVVAAVLARPPLRWPEVVALHPGDLGRGAATASAETIAEATLRWSSGFDWARVHRRAVRGDGALPSDLRRSEVNWMDPTMYGRWVIDSMVDPLLACEVLRTHAKRGGGAAPRSGGRGARCTLPHRG